MTKFSKFIGLDVHKESIAVEIADGRGGLPRYRGEIENRLEVEQVAHLTKEPW